jgi:hypothetical protein
MLSASTRVRTMLRKVKRERRVKMLRRSGVVRMRWGRWEQR